MTLVFEYWQRLFSLSSHAAADKTPNYKICRRYRHFGQWSYFHLFCLRNFSLSEHSWQALVPTPHDYLVHNEINSCTPTSLEWQLTWTLAHIIPATIVNTHQFQIIPQINQWWSVNSPGTANDDSRSANSRSLTVNHRKSGTAKCTDHQPGSRHSSGTGTQKCWFIVQSADEIQQRVCSPGRYDQSALQRKWKQCWKREGWNPRIRRQTTGKVWALHKRTGCKYASEGLWT